MNYNGFHPIDWAILVVYAAGLIGIGYIYSRRQANTSDYFIGAGRIPSWVMGISLFSSLFSAGSYLAMPGEMIKHGPTYLFHFLAIPFAYLVVGYVLIPAFMRERVISAYELLEKRLGRGIRTLGALLFVVLRLIWMTVLLYMGATAITVIFGFPLEYAFHVTLAIGAISVVYTSMGGIRAIMISDIVQSAILVLGTLFTLGVVTWSLKGFSWFPTEWNPQWKLQPVFSLDPHVRISLIGVIVMSFFWQVCTAGGDQIAIQRYMSTQDARSARRAFLFHSIMVVVVSLLVCSLGFALMEFYARFPELLPNGLTAGGSADRLFPFFIANQLPVGIRGLVAAALLSASMNGLDAGVNAITAVVTRDFLHRKDQVAPDNKTHVLRARLLALGIGGTAVFLSTQVANITGSFLDINKKTTNLFAAPIFGLFVLALFIKRANAFGASIGTIYGFTVAFGIAFWDLLTGLETLSFMWIMPPALATQLSIAFLLSGLRLETGRSRVAAWTLSLLPLAGAFGALLFFRLR